MEGLKEIDLPPNKSRRRITNACVQCQRKKKRCDGGMPQCTSCTERQLECTYLGVRHRGQGKAKGYLERLEAIASELETSIRPATRTSGPVEPAETYGIAAQATLPDGQDFPGQEATLSELNSRTDDHNKAEEALRDRSFRTLYEKTTQEKPRSEATWDPFTTPIFIQLPQKSHLQSLFKVTFAEVNHMALVFDLPMLLDILDMHFSLSTTFSQENYPQQWAMLNTAVAVAIKLRAAKGSEGKMTQMSWAYFKNAFGMYVPITLKGADLLALEALLAMAIYMQGSSDLRTTSILVAAGARLALTLGMHRETYYSGLDLAAANRARRAFWTCFVLDKDMSSRTALPSNFDEEAIRIDHLDLVVSTTSTTGISHGTGPRFDMSAAASALLQSSVKLAVIRSTVDKLLFSKDASEQSVHQLLRTVAELEHQLINWKAALPIHLRPDHINRSTASMASQPVILLYFVYYSTLSEIHGFAGRLDHQGDSSMIFQVKTARIAQVSAATEIIRLLQFVSREELPGYLWHILLYPISVCITLVSIVLESPKNAQARSRAQHISDFIVFLRGLQHDGVLDVQALLDLCCELESLVLDTISNALNGTSSSGSQHLQTLSYTHGGTSSLQLASGLMGNMPDLQSIAVATLSGMLSNVQISPSLSLLVPSSLNPETYGFTFA